MMQLPFVASKENCAFFGVRLCVYAPACFFVCKYVRFYKHPKAKPQWSRSPLEVSHFVFCCVLNVAHRVFSLALYVGFFVVVCCFCGLAPLSLRLRMHV